MSRKPAKALAASNSKSKQKTAVARRSAAPFRKVASLRDLRKVALRTQEDLAEALGVGQGTVSRIEKQNDMLVSTLQHYIESVGGKLTILATFPNRPPLIVERLGAKKPQVIKPPVDTQEIKHSSSATGS